MPLENARRRARLRCALLLLRCGGRAAPISSVDARGVVLQPQFPENNRGARRISRLRVAAGSPSRSGCSYVLIRKRRYCPRRCPIPGPASRHLGSLVWLRYPPHRSLLGALVDRCRREKDRMSTHVTTTMDDVDRHSAGARPNSLGLYAVVGMHRVCRAWGCA